MQASVQNLMDGSAFTWFDIVLLVWLGIGLFRGRKHGMSEELLFVLQWLLIVVICSQTYKPLAVLIDQNTPLDAVWASLAAYVLIAIAIRMVLVKLKSLLGEKLVGSDLFGGGEYYLGMMAGVVRFACMAIALMSLMNARIITKSERDATERMQAKNFEGIRFPTYGEIQQTVLFTSLSGQFVKKHLNDFLIASTTGDAKSLRSENSLGRKRESAVDEILNGARKPPPPKS